MKTIQLTVVVTVPDNTDDFTIGAVLSTLEKVCSKEPNFKVETSWQAEEA